MNTEPKPYFENGKQTGWLVEISTSRFIVFNLGYSDIIAADGFTSNTLITAVAKDSNWSTETQKIRKEMRDAAIKQYGSVEKALKAIFGNNLKKIH